MNAPSVTPVATNVIEFEPGRFLIGNTTVLLGTVGIVKRTAELGRVWVNLDCSTNQLTRIMIALECGGCATLTSG